MVANLIKKLQDTTGKKFDEIYTSSGVNRIDAYEKAKEKMPGTIRNELKKNPMNFTVGYTNDPFSGDQTADQTAIIGYCKGMTRKEGPAASLEDLSKSTMPKSDL